jgi:hypothetical protein
MPKMKVKDIQRNDDTGEKEATMMVTNDAIKFIKEAVAMYIQKGFGDKDDPKKEALIEEVQDDLHQAWKVLNPS